jgi:tetratricopeptide (TPR) repeat protein
MSWSRYAFLAGIVLALVFVVPTAWFPFQLSKVAVFSVGLLVSAVLFVIAGGARDLVRTRGFFAVLIVAALPIVYLFSAMGSPDKGLSLIGFGVETDTALFVTFAAIAYALSASLFKTLRTARMLSTAVFWALLVAAVFQLLSVFFGGAVIPFDTFADRSVNLIGKWNDLGIIAALLALLLFARVELGGATNLWRITAAVGGALLFILLSFVNFALAWGLLLAGSLVLGMLSLIRARAEQRTDAAQGGLVGILPWYAIAGVVASALFLLYGASLNASLTRTFPVSSLEVRPGLEATLEVIGAARTNSGGALFLGTGPNTFGALWLANKPAEVNRTPFWNLDFSVGYSTLATAFGTVGLIGALAWLAPLLLLAAALIRAIRLGALSREERHTASLLSLSSLFLLASLIFYVPSQNIILLAFVLSGAAFGFLWRQGRPAEEEPARSMAVEGLGVIALAAVLLVFTVVGSFSTVRRAVAQTYAAEGYQALAGGRIDDALALAARSQGIERTMDALRLQTEAGAQKLSRIAQDTSLSQADAQAQFSTLVQSVIPAGQAAILASPLDYRPYYSLARVYDLLASLKVEGAYTSAQAAYAAAAQRNPTSPVIPLAVARMEANAGNGEATEANLTKALQLKPDYTDAILFVVQINVANNDLKSAIENTQIAVQTAPGVASIWFQLGLLYYAGSDAKNAILSLEQSIKLVSDYANAKYFLGLAYYADGRQNDALRVFEELQVSNPDNGEVRAIVANLRSGKQPLDGMQAPAPEDRTTAPVSQ